LAIFAVQVTASRRDGKDGGARHEMEQRFFLDRVDMNRAGVAVRDGDKASVNIDADAAFAALAGFNQAPFRAQLALHEHGEPLE
jgi:hypothetical protein